MKRWAIIAVVLSLGLSGCSALRLVYSQGRELSYWWLNGYLDFDDAQAAVTREALDRWFAWHRRTQLPDYANWLSRAAAEAEQNITPAQACQWFDDLRARANTAVEQSLPDAVNIAAGFSNDQLAFLKRKLAKSNAEFRDDFLQPDPAVRLRKSVDRAIERTEQLYGRLNEAQRQQVAKAVAASPFDADRWFAERERRQGELLQMLAQLQAVPQATALAVPGKAGAGASPSAATAPSNASSTSVTETATDRTTDTPGVVALRAHWQHTLRSPDPAYAAYQKKLEAYNCEFFAEIHNQTTPEQRREAQRRLRGWESDFRRLSAS